MQQENQTEITLLGGRVRLLVTATGGFRPGLDAVLLAAACPAREGERVLDMGCGTFAAGLCLAARVKKVQLTGAEIVPEMADLARRNAALNEPIAPAKIVCTDILSTHSDLPTRGFGHVICNPPYLESGTYMASPDDLRAHAMGHRDDEGDLGAWIRAAHKVLISKGSLTLIHRADQMDHVIQALGRMFGDITIIPFWPHANEPARRVIVRAFKDRRGPLTLHPGVILHGPDEAWTPAAHAILADGAEL